MGEFARFVYYRDLPQRNVKSLCEVFGVAKSSLTDQCVKWAWTARAAAWDNELDRRLRETEVSALQKMQVQQIKIGAGLQMVGATELRVLQKKQERADAMAASSGFAREPILPAREIVRLIEAGSKLERLNRGEATESISVNGAVRTDQVPPEERRARIDYLLKVIRGSDKS